MGGSLWIWIAMGLVGLGNALVGRHLVLQRKSSLGDALAHVSFPSLISAVLITHSLNPLSLFLASLLGAGLTLFLVQRLQSKGRLPEDLSIGVVFLSLFALGVFLSSVYLRNSHIDVECLLFGELLYVPLEVTGLGGIPQSVALLLIAVGFLLVAEFLFGKTFLALNFEREKSRYHSTALNSLLYFLVSSLLIASFKIVGGLLVVAFLCIPASLAKLRTSTHRRFLVRTVVVALTLAWSGLGLGLAFNTNPAAAAAAWMFVVFIAVTLAFQRPLRMTVGRRRHEAHS